MNQFGYCGILLLIAVENIFPPIPSEVILTFGGFLTTCTSMNIWGVILFATVGSVLGAVVLYAVGRYLNYEKLQRWIGGRWGRRLHLKKEDISQAVDWFSRRGASTVFFCRFIPIVRSLISIPAGVAKMNPAKFIILTTAGTLIWNTVLVYLGAFTGASWESIAIYLSAYSKFTIIVLGFIVVLFCVIFYNKRILK